MKTILLGLMAVCPLTARAQAAVAEPTMAFSASGAFFALSVPDIDASARWYREKFGMTVVLNGEHNGTRIVGLEGGGLIVELIERPDAVPLASVAPAAANDINRVHGFVKAGVIVNDWDALVKTLRERGVEIVIGPFPTRPGKRANLVVKDNNGNLIQFFGP
jgi:extradiol dioxygenase family protein